ncbi:MAG: formate dehydrogenase accessory sulfurtransferase FdhD [Peptostreptococcaceae bacterium]|nr:formate dehydrogenase accessory sulfurtransferase FdhD [Peptostreptococcaceae bacterium]
MNIKESLMDEMIFSEVDVLEIISKDGLFNTVSTVKKTIAEMYLKVYINEVEMISLLCLTRNLEELTLGFLFNEGVIESIEDVKKISYNDRMHVMHIILRDEIQVDRMASLRSVTASCGECLTYINPLKQELFRAVESRSDVYIGEIIKKMTEFERGSEIFSRIGSVHSALLHTKEKDYFAEDLGRHNCIDKVAGMMLLEEKLNLAEEAILFTSGRVPSEIMIKAVRLGIPVVVSRTTPTLSAVSMAKQYNITLIGYARKGGGIIYSCPERLKMNQ